MHLRGQRLREPAPHASSHEDRDGRTLLFSAHEERAAIDPSTRMIDERTLADRCAQALVRAAALLAPLLIASGALLAHAQGARGVPLSGNAEQRLSARARDARPTLFLSCPLECFDAYLRQELSYFDFSRDPYRAELTIVVVRQQAGNGGERFTVTMTPRVPSADLVLTPATFTVPSGTADVVSRRKLSQAILRMLQTYLRGSAHEEAIELRLPPRSGASLSTLDDPWDYWVFAPELNAAGEGGSGFYFVEGAAALTIRRITEANKLRLRGSYGPAPDGELLPAYQAAQAYRHAL